MRVGAVGHRPTLTEPSVVHGSISKVAWHCKTLPRRLRPCINDKASVLDFFHPCIHFFRELCIFHQLLYLSRQLGQLFIYRLQMVKTQKLAAT